MKTPSAGPAALRRLIQAVALIGCAWYFYVQAIVPQREKTRSARATIVNLEARIRSANETIRSAVDLEQSAEAARARLKDSRGDLPGGSPLFWLADRLREHFDRFGVANVVVRENSTLDDPHLTGYRRTYWWISVEIPETERSITGLLLATAALKKEQPFLETIDFTIRADLDHPEGRVAVVNVSTLLEE